MVNQAVLRILLILARGMAGWLTGLFAGISGGIVVAVLAGLLSNDRQGTLMIVALVGGGLGSSVVGVIVAWLMSAIQYRTRTGFEWGIIGAASALLLVWPLQLSLAALIVMAGMYAVAAISAYRVVAALFEYKREAGRITFKAVAIFSAAALLMSGAIYSVLEGFALLFD